MGKFVAPASGTGKVVLAHGLCSLSFVAVFFAEALGYSCPMMSLADQHPGKINPNDFGYQLAMLWVAVCSLTFATAEIAILAWLDAKLMEKVQQWFVLYHVPLVAVVVYAALLDSANEFAWIPVAVIGSFTIAGVVFPPKAKAVKAEKGEVMKSKSRAMSQSRKKK